MIKPIKKKSPYLTQQIDGLYSKVSELVDAVNELQKHEEQHLDLLTQLNEMRLHQNKEPADPYAEQRKWIGCLCIFKNKEFGANCFDTLIRINDFGEFESCRHGVWKHCEPVKPDDDIIYKGGGKDE